MSSPSPPPPPNYQPIADASREQYLFQREVALAQLDWAKQQYADNKPYSDAVREKLMVALDKNTKESDEMLARYKKLYHPVEDAFVKDVQNYDSAGRKEDQRSGAIAQVGQAFDAANASAERALEASGVDPSEVRFGALNLGTKLARAQAQAGAGVASDRAIDANALALKANALGIGKGQPAQALGFQTAGNQAGTGGVQTGNQTTAGAAGSLGNPLGWSSAATNSVGTWGNVVNSAYQNQMAGYNAQMQGGSGWGQAAGMAAGLGMMALRAADGGTIPDEDELAQHGAVPMDHSMEDEGAEHDGMLLTPDMSPSGGAAIDDIPAVGPGGARVRVDEGEFIIPERVTRWYGEKFFQNLIAKADKAAEEAPAQPEIRQEGAGAVQMASMGGMPRSMEAINMDHMAPGAPRVTSRGTLPHLTTGVRPGKGVGMPRTVPKFGRRAA